MHEPPIAITRSDLPGLTWVALRGDLDLGGAGLVGDELRAICNARSHVAIDARGLGFVDLAGIRLLSRLQQRMAERGARLSLVPGPLVARLARLTELDTVLEAADVDPDVLLGLAGAGAGAAAAARDAAALRALVATECARHHDLVARMTVLADRAQSAVEAARGTQRTIAAGRARRAAPR